MHYDELRFPGPDRSNDLLMLTAQKALDRHERDFMELLDNPLYCGHWLFDSDAFGTVLQLRDLTKQARRQLGEERARSRAS